MSDLIDMINVVIQELEEKILKEEYPDKLHTLLAKYYAAKHELATTGTITTNLLGGIQLYLQSYSDYMNNQLLDNMYVVEKALRRGMHEGHTKCCFCGKELPEKWMYNNPEPLCTVEGSVCCPECNDLYVRPARRKSWNPIKK